MRFEPVDIVHDRPRRIVVAFGGRKLQQLAGIIEAVRDAIKAIHELAQARTFAAEILRALRIVPDVGAFEFAGYFFETFALDRVVKETP
jgi:hypothetical protein